MKVVCDRGSLLDSLNLVGSVVLSRTPKPVLGCVKLEAEADGGLTLTATDAEVAVRLTSPRVDVQDAGEALIPANKLHDIVRESIDPTLTLDAQADTAQIIGQDSRYRLNTQPVGDFPATPTFDGDEDYEISAGELHRMVAMTIFATARENSRYAINGVLFERKGNKLAVVATDGHRLALAKGSCKGKSDESVPAIIPTKALNLLLKLFDDADQTVKVKYQDGTALFVTDAAVMSTNLVEGNFPPYKDVIPKDGDKHATIASDVFVSAVRRAALLTNEESKGVRMAFAQGKATFSSRAPEMGEAEINIELTEYSGDEMEIGFNPAYLLDALKVVDEPQVVLDMKAPNKPGILRTGPNFLYVIMPVNLQ